MPCVAEYKRGAAGEKVAEYTIEIVCIASLSGPLGDEDAPHREVARSRYPQPDRYRHEHPESLGVRHAERIENPQRTDEFGMNRWVEGHPSRVVGKILCV
jgi:hypothetical protein